MGGLSTTSLECGSFFFSSRRRHTRCSRDWSSDVCSSDLLFAAHLVLNSFYGFGNIIRHVPFAAAAADLVHEAMQELRALARVRHLGMELHAVEAPRFIGHAGDRARLGRGHELEAGGQRGDLVAVARSEEHTSELQSRLHLVCRLLLEKKKKTT